MIKSHWYKILSVCIILYVLIVGMTVPLKPGITKINPDSFKAGEEVTINITGYNSNYKSENQYRAWLKFDSIHIIEAKSISVSDEQNMEATFNIPVFLPFKKLTGFASLILNGENDGSSILPGRVYFEQDNISYKQDAPLWKRQKITLQKPKQKFRFPYRNILNETIRNTFFHVAIWFAMFFLMILSMWHSIQYLRTKDFGQDIKASSFADVAIVFGFIGLATGSIWAKFTWGTYWTDDVKLNMTAIAMLIYTAYWILRGSINDVDSRARFSAAYNIFAFLMLIPLIFIIPRMTDSLHPGNGGNPALGGEDLDNTLRVVFYPAIIAYSMLGFWISSLLIRVRNLEEKSFLQDKK